LGSGDLKGIARCNIRVVQRSNKKIILSINAHSIMMFLKTLEGRNN
jgi:hypothetical protein